LPVPMIATVLSEIVIDLPPVVWFPLKQLEGSSQILEAIDLNCQVMVDVR
jgi:hypothetical protein